MSYLWHLVMSERRGKQRLGGKGLVPGPTDCRNSHEGNPGKQGQNPAIT